MRHAVLLLGLLACDEPKPTPGGAPWTQRAELPDGTRRLEASSTGLGARLVVIGGFVTSDAETPRLEITRDMLELDPFTETWTKSPIEAPAAWTHANLTSFGGSLYMMGGLEGEQFVPSGKTYRLRPTATAWEELAPMPTGLERGAAAVVGSNGHIFLFGGATATGTTSSVLDYAIATNTWSELTPLPTPRSHAAAMRTNDGVFIVAGGLSVQGELGDTYALPPGPNQPWILREPMPTARGGCAYGELYGQLVCAGGVVSTTSSSFVDIYDPNTNTWRVSVDIPVARAGATGAIVTSRLFVVGGSDTTALVPTSTVYEFDLLDTVPR